MNIIPNENTFQGHFNGSNPNLQSAAVMEKAKVNHRFYFFPSPFQLIRRLLRMEDIALLEAMTPRRAGML